MFHSNTSRFNQRQPKAGPSTILPRHHHDTSQKLSLDIPKRASNTTAFKEEMDMTRPINTNSRVKQDEKYKKDMYLAFVNNALLQKLKGNSEPFDELVNQFSSANTSEYGEASIGMPATQLRLWISALSHVVSQIERTHSALIQAIVGMPWTTMDAGFVKAYVAFIGMLVSARPEYLSLVLERIARGFTFRLLAIDPTNPEKASSPLTRRVVYDRLHHILEHLLSLIPTLPTILQPLLVRNFPHKRQDRADQETYIRNLLRITEYCPALTDRILSTIIDSAIQIDVEIQVELEELEADEGAKNMEDILLDPFDTVVGEEGSDSEDEEEDDLSDISSDAGGDPDDEIVPEIQQDIAQIRDMVDKLDSMLKLLFDYFHRIHCGLSATQITPTSQDSLPDVSLTSSPTRLPPTSRGSSDHGRSLRRTQFITLLSIFDRTIIRTFKSRYTQFLVFWYSSLDPTFTDMFQGMLISKALLEEMQPVVTRVAAASYIASFVSRARFVDAVNARRVVGLLCDFLEAHLDYCATMGKEFDPSSAAHTLFYAVSQAVFLIFCFRWRDFQVDDEIEMDDIGIESNIPKKWIPTLSVIQRVITSELNPLKICSPNVVQQFARVARSTGFVYCYTILENNRRTDLHRANSSPPKRITPSSTQSPYPLLSRDAADADLNTFFPFDPYKLPLSYSYIQGVYREWASVALDEEEEDDGDGDEDEGGDKEEEVDLIAPSRSSWNLPSAEGDDGTSALGTSFGGMSISPIRSSLLSRPTLVV
ncbi:RNA polymerase I-specific transcription initiation factor RRN3 [Hysterangium stoloniferum]|nr:RNA polymerase I-specific transcription initiation factor RRN3 [Hysterangium stoloniferum]